MTMIPSMCYNVYDNINSNIDASNNHSSSNDDNNHTGPG